MHVATQMQAPSTNGTAQDSQIRMLVLVDIEIRFTKMRVTLCPDHVMDDGIKRLKNMWNLCICWSTSIKGYGLIELVKHQKLKCLILFGDRSSTIYDFGLLYQLGHPIRFHFPR